MGLFFWVSWWPFQFSFYGGNMAYVEWPPFKFLLPEYWGDGKKDVLKIVTFIPIGVFLAAVAKGPTTVKGIIVRAIGGGLTFGLVNQIGWFFLPARSVSATALVLNILGTLAGASPLCFHYLHRRLLGILTAGYGLCFLIAATWPWNFSLRAAALPRLFQRIEWLHFPRGIAMWELKDDALNSLITVPLGLLAASYILRHGSGRRALTSAIALAMGCSLTVEGLQCFLPTRTPSFSDITLNTLGGLAGGAIAYYLERRHFTASSSSIYANRQEN